MCPYCKVKRKRLSRHCFFCNKCIKEQNYHCNIINNCIGQNNWGGYIFFLVMHMIIFCYMCLTSVKVLLIQDLALEQIQYIIHISLLHNNMVKNITAISIISISIFGFIVVFIITFRHIRQLIINHKIKELAES